MPSAKEQLRVLIVRLGAMGDILHALPAVTALRQSHPNWFLGWVVEPRWQALLVAEPSPPPLVDRIHLASARSWARSPLRPGTFREIRTLRKELRSERYDVCVDLQGAVRSAAIGRLAGSPRMVGEEDPREPVARWLFTERVSTHGAHMIEQAMEVCAAIADRHLECVRPVLPVSGQAEAWADRELAAREAKPVVLVSPGAGWGAKRWPAERFGEVAARLSAVGYLVLVNAGPEEREIAAEVVQASGGTAQAPEFTLERLIAMTRRARLTIAGDTGPLHLACALGKPVVGIFGPTEPKRNGPFGVPFHVLRHPQSKRDHSRRAETDPGLLTITPEQVVMAAMDLLNRQGTE